MNVKQVICIRRDLHMRRGKECAQAAHASMAWLTSRMRFDCVHGSDAHAYSVLLTEAEQAWVKGIFAKIVVKVNSEAELRDVYEKAKAAGLEAQLIIDCGLTEFGGVPTATACGIGPDLADKIDPVTGSLELY